jgi:hypothetical protein
MRRALGMVCFCIFLTGIAGSAHEDGDHALLEVRLRKS